MFLNPSRKIRILQRFGNPWGKHPTYYTDSEMSGYCTPKVIQDKNANIYDHSQCWHTLKDSKYQYCNFINPVKCYEKELQLTIAALIVTTPWMIGLINLIKF